MTIFYIVTFYVNSQNLLNTNTNTWTVGSVWVTGIGRNGGTIDILF
ncbi:hypothetical protein [Tenacibaculum dicentrarchi]